MEIKASHEPLSFAALDEMNTVQEEDKLFTILNPASTDSKISENWRNTGPTAWGQDAMCGLND